MTDPMRLLRDRLDAASQQVVRQPDGRYAVFSTDTEKIAIWNAVAEELIELFAENGAERICLRRAFERIGAGGSEHIHGRLVLTWDEALENDREHGGEAWRACES